MEDIRVPIVLLKLVMEEAERFLAFATLNDFDPFGTRAITSKE